MILEMRVYRCIPGRLPNLIKRFDTITLKLWEKHGIKQAGFWTVLIGNGNHDLHYLIAWESLGITLRERARRHGMEHLFGTAPRSLANDDEPVVIVSDQHDTQTLSEQDVERLRGE